VKGIAHFCTGVAIATFFPEVVQGTAQALSFGPLLGGLAGLLPDTLDFKFVRYFQRLDEEIDPAKIITEAGLPDPQAMAERVAAAMNRAYERGEPIQVQLHTLRLGADLWRQYSIAFDLTRNEVVVRIGPLVTTAQVPYAASEPPGLEPGRAQVDVRILPTYDAETRVDIFSGPSLAFQRAGDAVEVVFLPWHRAWTHSLAMALLLGGVGFLVAPVYGLVMALAVLAHVAVDQLGFMGSNWFFPLSSRRTAGLGWIRSGDALPNFLVVWIGLATILLNLDRFSAAPMIPLLPYTLGVIVAPVLFVLGLSAWTSLRAQRQPTGVLRGFAPRVRLAQRLQAAEGLQAAKGLQAAVEALDETHEVDI
jgi:membrane-bound metal-dependent hydrolase YbcI (DUF457 family)